MLGKRSSNVDARCNWWTWWLPKPERAVPSLRGLKVIKDAAGNHVAPELVPWNAVTKIELDLWGMDIDASPLSLRRFSRRFALDGSHVSTVALRAQHRALKNSLVNGSLRVEESFENPLLFRWLGLLSSASLAFIVINTVIEKAPRMRRIGFFDVPPEYLPVAWSLAVLLVGAAVFGAWAAIWMNLFYFTAPFVRRATITSRGISADMADGTKRKEEWSGLTDLRRPFDLRFANGSRLVCLVRNRRQRLLFRLLLEHRNSEGRGINSERDPRGQPYASASAKSWLGDCELADRPQLAPIHAKPKATFPWLLPIGVVCGVLAWHFGKYNSRTDEHPWGPLLFAILIVAASVSMTILERNVERLAARRIKQWKIAHRQGRAKRRGTTQPSRSD